MGIDLLRKSFMGLLYPDKMNISREKQTKTEGICPVTFHRLRNSGEDLRIFEDFGANQRIPEHFQDAGKQVSDNSEKGAENSRIFRIILQNPLTFGGTGSILYLVFLCLLLNTGPYAPLFPAQCRIKAFCGRLASKGRWVQMYFKIRKGGCKYGTRFH